MDVLMLGWEFPPFFSGGLGTACYGLSKGLSKHGVKVTFVMPNGPHDIKHDFLKKIIVTNSPNLKLKRVSSLLKPYLTSKSYSDMYAFLKSHGHNLMLYGQDLFEEVHRFAEQVLEVTDEEEFEVIHCHDWMTFPAGINLKKIKKKPLVVQVHATEWDRTGGLSANPEVYRIEKQGMQEADKIITVSNYTKKKIIENYNINPEKISVVYNAVEPINQDIPKHLINDKDKIVLFVGRLTLQKGPDYFIDVAKKVLEFNKNVKFIIAGSGDMERFLIEKATWLGISDKIFFTGFISSPEINKIYKMADVYVMPSVSDPFGITALEAVSNKVPVLISKSCGVSEVLKNCLRVDFWDINEMTNKILALLRYRELHETIIENSYSELDKFSWEKSAYETIQIYQSLIGGT